MNLALYAIVKKQRHLRPPVKPIERAAVLGAGTMGSRIAAHLANAAIPTLLLDLPGPAEDRNRLARTGRGNALKQTPAAFFLPEYQERVILGNFDDHLERLAGCDWIIEAVAEDLEIKRGLLARVEKVRRAGAVVSTNTSGIPVTSISEGFGDDFRQHWLGTHFFNPPRYMHLVEIIPGSDTLPAVVDWTSEICDRRLGKGVVKAKDTPNFIANRIGAFSGVVVFRLMEEYGLTLEEVDALTGPVIGNPKSATFRTLDLAGIDVAAHVIRNLHQNLPGDPHREWFRLPAFVEQMLERNWLGDKTGHGFYRRQKRNGEPEIWALDWKTLEYHPRQKARFASIEMAKNVEDIRQRLPLLLGGSDRASEFLWKLFSEVFVYTASLVGEICDTVVEVDRAMRWGYGRELGPFEACDVLGVEKAVERLRHEQRPGPRNVERMLAAGARSFYQQAEEKGEAAALYFDLRAGCYRPLEPRPGILVLKDLKRARREIKCNAGASLQDECHWRRPGLHDDGGPEGIGVQL